MEAALAGIKVARLVGFFDGDVLIHELHGWLIEGFTVRAPIPTVRTESLGNDMSTQSVTTHDPECRRLQSQIEYRLSRFGEGAAQLVLCVRVSWRRLRHSGYGTRAQWA